MRGGCSSFMGNHHVKSRELKILCEDMNNFHGRSMSESTTPGSIQENDNRSANCSQNEPLTKTK